MKKIAALLPISDELLRDSGLLNQSIAAWIDMTPAERAEAARHRATERANERVNAPRQDVTVMALVSKLNWTVRYAEHFVQPYCYCNCGSDGWEYCEHARDEGLTNY